MVNFTHNDPIFKLLLDFIALQKDGAVQPSAFMHIRLANTLRLANVLSKPKEIVLTYQSKVIRTADKLIIPANIQEMAAKALTKTVPNANVSTCIGTTIDTLVNVKGRVTQVSYIFLILEIKYPLLN